MWKIDDIELSSYGVGVQKTTGLLDMPKVVDKPNDWLDLSGIDYWQDAADMKYSDREITLHCWIASHEGYADFKLKVAAFFAALSAEGLRTLKYGNSVIAQVYIEKNIELPRKTSYVDSLQVGLFNLRLTVPGDVNYHSLTIRRWTGTENIDVATVLTNNLKVRKTLQGEIYATCSFESNVKLDLKYFDFFRINSNGVNDDTFHLPAAPSFEKKSTNLYKYDLKFEHQGKWLDHSQFLNDLGEADFYYYANMEEIVELIVSNHNRSWWENFWKGTIAATERRNHKFAGETCLSVLRRLCVEYELEYEFEYIGISRYNINVAEQVANDKAVTLEYGKDNGLYELSRGEADLSKLCTKLFAYGAAKNIPADYRNGMLRLSFDGNPLSNNDDLLTQSGPHEVTKYFDEIYPHRTGTVTGFEMVLPAALTDAEKETFPEGKFIITDNSLAGAGGFDINDYLSGGLTAKIRMNTGDNAGFEFEINHYDHLTQKIYITPFKDERGTIYPNADLHPIGESTPGAGDGDEYVLVDIELPAAYIAAAETELANAAADYISEYSVPKFPYKCRIDPAFMAANPGGFEIGDRVTVTDTDFGIDGLFRISELQYDIFRKEYEFTLSDIAEVTFRKQLLNRISTVERSLQDTGKDTVEAMRNDQATTNEIRNILLYPTLDKLKVDNIVRNNSLDPRMISLDSISFLFSMKNALYEPNYEENEDKLRFNAGTFTIHNFDGLSRYEIKKLKELEITYDPTRTWNIPETVYTLPTKDDYNIYLKLDLTNGSTDSELEFSTAHIEGKYQIEDNILRINLGNTGAGEEAA